MKSKKMLSEIIVLFPIFFTFRDLNECTRPFWSRFLLTILAIQLNKSVYSNELNRNFSRHMVLYLISHILFYASLSFLLFIALFPPLFHTVRMSFFFMDCMYFFHFHKPVFYHFISFNIFTFFSVPQWFIAHQSERANSFLINFLKQKKEVCWSFCDFIR